MKHERDLHHSPPLCPPELCFEKPGWEFSVEIGRTQRVAPRLRHWIGFAVAGLTASCLFAAEPTVSPTPDTIPKLPVTTGWLGNSLLRGGQADWKDSSQTYLQLYTSDMAVTGDGRIYCTTTWEEGARAAGIYKEGDALEEIPGFGVDSGFSVAVTDKLLAYGRKGKIGVFTRGKDGKHEVASGRDITFDATPSAPNVTGVCIDEAKDIVYAGDESGVIRSFQFSSGKAINAAGFAAPRVGQMRLDASGNIWALQTRGEATYTLIAATAFGSEPKEGHTVQDALAATGGKDFFEAKDDAGFVGLDLGQATAVHSMRFCGAGDTTLVGAKLQGSTTGPTGPWQDIVKIEYEPRGWPATTIPLDGTAWNALRLAGARMGVVGLGVFTRQAVEPGAVVKFSPEGERLTVITEVANPFSIALDPAHDRLLVFDNSPAQQIVAFTGLAGNPRLDKSFGEGGRFGKKGGLPAAQGRLGDRVFDQVRGLGVDARGNLIVFNVGGSGMSQSRLESYAPGGKLNWRMVGMAFLDSADVDPGAPEEAWSCTAHYRRDPAGTEGDGWRLLGTSLDKMRFPDDPRVNGGGAQTLGVRRIGGQRFLFTTTQGGSPVSVFRFDAANGFNGIPCAYLSGLHSSREWPPHQPPGGGLTLWRDASGDGQFQAAEFTKASDLSMLPVTLDAAGNLWYLLDRKSISVLDADSLDAHGVPAWSFATARHLAWPAAFADPAHGSMRRIVVAPDGQSLVAFGFTKDLPSVVGHNMPLGRLAVRYAIEGTALRETHRVVLPYDVNLQNAKGDQGYVATGAGDYIFVGYEQRMTVLVYKAGTLELVGRIDIGPQSQTPIFDGPPELIVSQRGATYEIFLPQYTGNATTVLTWKPSDKTWIPAPTDLSATRLEKAVEVSWKSATDATGWQIERRTLESTGWSAWKKAGATIVPLTVWRDSESPTSACAYRLRALGADGAASDWSKTSYVR